MTLPIDIIFPLRPDQIRAGGQQLELYIRDLVNSLTDMYKDVVNVVNGSLRQFTPVIAGRTTAGTGTYSWQSGWYLRQGLMVDVWFDVQWTAHTGTGVMYLILPYKVANSENRPFAGTLATSTLAYTAGYTATFCEAEPDTFRCNLVQYGSGVAMANFNVTAAGRLIGHVRYPGQEFEN